MKIYKENKIKPHYERYMDSDTLKLLTLLGIKLCPKERVTLLNSVASGHSSCLGNPLMYLTPV